jgi:DNA-binding transcriptional ArsR family regulator
MFIVTTVLPLRGSLSIVCKKPTKLLPTPLDGVSYKYLRGGEHTAGELAEHAKVGRTALSHHLTVLKLADLVRVERRGQFQIYSLNTTVFQDLMTEIMGWLGGMDEPPESGQQQEDSSHDDTIADA